METLVSTPSKTHHPWPTAFTLGPLMADNPSDAPPAGGGENRAHPNQIRQVEEYRQTQQNLDLKCYWGALATFWCRW